MKIKKIQNSAFFLSVFFLVSLFFCCLPKQKGLAESKLALEKAQFLPIDKTPLIIDSVKGKQKFFIEIAKTAEQAEKGLMFRDVLPLDRAMLFSFPQEGIYAMWMVNTPHSLDMLFIDREGFIQHIEEETVPYSETQLSSKKKVKFVLELAGGSVKQRGIQIGDRVVHPYINLYRK